MRNQFLLIAALLFFHSSPFCPTNNNRKDNRQQRLTPAGVSVKVKGTNRGTLTNNAGDFSIQASSDDVIGNNYYWL